VTSLSCGLVDLVVVAAWSALFAQNGGQGKLQDHASIPDAATSIDFSPENPCGRELRNPWLVRRTLSVAMGRRYRCKLFGPLEKVSTIRVPDTSSFCRQLLLIK